MSITRLITLILPQFVFISLVAQVPKMVTPMGHLQEITATDFSPDGSMIVTASNDKTVKIWDRQTGRLLKDFNEFEVEISTACFTPDGKKLMIGLKEVEANKTFPAPSSIIIIDIFSGKTLMKFTGHKKWITCAGFSRDGKKIVSGSWDGAVIVWNALTGDSLAIFHHSGEVSTAHFSHDGKKILTSSGDNNAAIWDIASKKRLYLLSAHNGSVASAEFSPDEKMIVTASYDSTLMIWNALTGKPAETLKGHQGACRTASFSPDGRFVLSAADDDVPIIWNIATGKVFRTLYDPDAKRSRNEWRKMQLHDPGGKGIMNARFSPDGQFIFSTSFDGYLRKWEVASGNLLHKSPGHRNYMKSIQFSPDGKYLLTSSMDLTCKLWSIDKLENIQTLAARSNFARSASFSTDGKFILTASSLEVKIWSAAEGKLLRSLPGTGYSLIKFAKYSPDGEIIAAATNDGIVLIYQIDTGEKLLTIDTYTKSEIASIAFNNDGRIFAVVCPYHSINPPLLSGFTFPENKNYVKVYKTSDGKILDSVLFTSLLTQAIFRKDNNLVVLGSKAENNEDVYGGVRTGAFSGDESYFVTGELFSNGENFFSNLAKLEPVTPGGKIDSLKGHTLPVLSVAFSPDNKYIVTASEDKTARIWDVKTRKTVHVLRGHSSYLTAAEFSPDGQRVITSGSDNTFKVWNVRTGNLLFTLVAIDSADFLCQTVNGYYYGTKEAVKLLHYTTPDLKMISFEQLDVKFNRPDKVLGDIGLVDSSLLKYYRFVYEKRLKNLGIDTNLFREDFSVPEADIINRSEKPVKGSLKLRISCTDKSLALERFNVWINETPVYGRNGISLKYRRKQSFDTIITVELSEGYNRIETSVFNSSSIESYRKPLVINYTPESTPAVKNYFIGIGINEFAEPGNNLKYCVKDIKDLATKLTARYNGNIQIDTIFNTNVTLEKLRALKQKISKCGINDRVIIVYSGHGLLSSNMNFYLSSYTVNFKYPEINGIRYEELENLLDGIQSRRKLLLVDACHSGEFDKAEYAGNENSPDSKIVNPDSKGHIRARRLTMQDGFELMKDLFVNVGRGTGATIISAASGVDFAKEDKEAQNGLFISVVLDALRKYPSMLLSDLKKYVMEAVVSRSGGEQQPTFRNDPVDVNWKVW